MNTQMLAIEQGRALVALARRVIGERLGGPPPSTTSSLPSATDPALQNRQGTFVTIKIRGQLRGCIGNLAGTTSIYEGIRQNALNAAFHDPRFPPLRPEEFAAIHIAISVLTPAQPLAHQGGADLLDKLRPGIDGVIIRKGAAGATFLPQVWEQLPRPTDFLAHLCRKAGLPPDAWQGADLAVATYQAQYFAEAE